MPARIAGTGPTPYRPSAGSRSGPGSTPPPRHRFRLDDGGLSGDPQGRCSRHRRRHGGGLRSEPGLDTTLDRLTRAHGGIGHNRPPEEIQYATLSRDLCEETVKTVHSLRDDINAPNPDTEAIRAKTHVLRRAAESLAAFLGRKWEKVTDKMAETVFLGATVAYGPLVYKYALDAHNQIGELIRAVEGWITSLPSLF